MGLTLNTVPHEHLVSELYFFRICVFIGHEGANFRDVGFYVRFKR